MPTFAGENLRDGVRTTAPEVLEEPRPDLNPEESNLPNPYINKLNAHDVCFLRVEQ